MTEAYLVMYVMMSNTEARLATTLMHGPQDDRRGVLMTALETAIHVKGILLVAIKEGREMTQEEMNATGEALNASADLMMSI